MKPGFLHAGALLAIALLGACADSSSDINSSSGGSSGGNTPAFEAIDEMGGMPVGYSLVWNDDFNTSGTLLPDATKWGYDTHANPTGWYNNELQYYANARLQNSRVENGALVIEAHLESTSGFADNNGQPYTSARLVTQGRASWTYGFIEVRAKIPCGQGSWPAIWMLADVPNLQWPLDGEIDIMEHVNDTDDIQFSVHTQQHNHAQGTQATHQNQIVVCDNSFHRYQLTWTSDQILIGMNDRNYLRYTNQGNGKSQWPFYGPQYLLLNIAVGGDWPGAPDASTVFPMRMEVDFVRVYQ